MRYSIYPVVPERVRWRQSGETFGMAIMQPIPEQPSPDRLAVNA
ncbi:hypothetical protein [Paraburkholderia sp. DHOC27]|nr:hypothetical protein [Paraburkholderia sp. DHOC27]